MRRRYVPDGVDNRSYYGGSIQLRRNQTRSIPAAPLMARARACAYSDEDVGQTQPAIFNKVVCI